MVISLHSVEVEAFTTLSKRVTIMNKSMKIFDVDAWPPNQPGTFTPLVLIHHREQRTPKQVTEMAKLVQTGDIDSVVSGEPAPKRPKLDSQDSDEILQHIFNTSVVTKNVSEILAPLEENDKFILIEGAPGIGKSVLLKHVAIQWGKRLILCMFKVVLLLCLRDLYVQQAKSVTDLIQYFLRGDKKATDISSDCSDYLFDNGGEGIVFLFDGYDELPGDLQKDGLIADIINRKILPCCGLVVSSRPHASVSLRSVASVRVDILGFAEKERQEYIKQALKGKSQEIAELTQYLQCNHNINDLCFIPFNMTVLLFLYINGVSLPKNSANMYCSFICQAFCRHIKKSNLSLELATTIETLADLPEPFSRIISQLSKLSLECLNNNKLVFSVDDIKTYCPAIIDTEGTVNGYGLLQTIKHFSLTGETMTFNFIHFTIQEYFAANYITHLSPDQKFLQRKFWNNLYANMFAIYVALTKGQQPSFRLFLSGGDSQISIQTQFLKDYLKCFHLFYCFHEAGDKEMCKSIKEAPIFAGNEIDLNSRVLLPNHVRSMSFFITKSSTKYWEKLRLGYCYIRDDGLRVLHRSLEGNDVTINTLYMWDNEITCSSSSLISDLVLTCKVEQLYINGNPTIGERKELYNILTHPSSVLTYLNMSLVKLSSAAAKMLFAAVKDNNKLKTLHIRYNDLPSNVGKDIVDFLQVNTSLETLEMDHNCLSGEAIIQVVKALQGNNTLTWLKISEYASIIKNKIESENCKVNAIRKEKRLQELQIFFC